MKIYKKSGEIGIVIRIVLSENKITQGAIAVCAYLVISGIEKRLLPFR